MIFDFAKSHLPGNEFRTFVIFGKWCSAKFILLFYQHRKCNIIGNNELGYINYKGCNV